MSGIHDVTPGFAGSISGTLCVLNEMGGTEKLNGANRKKQDILRIELEIQVDIDSANQLIGLKTMPALRRPEFFCGKMNSTTVSKVKRAITASQQSRDMCSEWAECADKTSRINDKILKWCQNEFPRADSGHYHTEKAGKAGDVGNGSRGESESSGKSFFGDLLRRVLCCGYKPPGAQKEKGLEVNESQIFIKKLNGTIFSLNINVDKPKGDGKNASGTGQILTATVGMLKRKIHQEKGIPPELQFLVFENRNLAADDILLHDCGVTSQSTIHLIQLRSVLGVEESVTVTATEERGIEFKEETFRGLYRWHRDGQLLPDVYMGEFLNGMLLAV
jgi:hypothetical protein